jgi:hypothetical protein
MYDITRTRMLVTTAACAAGAALFAGQNVVLPNDGEAQASIGVRTDTANAPSWRGKGGKGEESDGLRGQASIATGADAAKAPSWRGKGGKGEE